MDQFSLGYIYIIFFNVVMRNIFLFGLENFRITIMVTLQQFGLSIISMALRLSGFWKTLAWHSGLVHGSSQFLLMTRQPFPKNIQNVVQSDVQK